MRRADGFSTTPRNVTAAVLLTILPLAAPGLTEKVVDYQRDIQPLLSKSCSGQSCHIDRRTSGVELTSYETVMASVGEQYGDKIVVPGKPAQSPIVDKISNEPPSFGRRMPFGRSPLEREEIHILEHWIGEGALERPPLRGDVDNDGKLTITDAIRILNFLFRGGDGPHCPAQADPSSSASVDLSDVMYILVYLFVVEDWDRTPLPLESCRLSH